MCGNLFSAIIGLQFCRKRDSGSYFPLNFAKCLKTPNDMPRGFKTKCEINESN